MELRYQDKKTKDTLDIIKNILNNRLYYDDKEITELKEQLKQRDEVIDEAIKYIKYHDEMCEAQQEELDILDILQKYKGDKK